MFGTRFLIFREPSTTVGGFLFLIQTTDFHKKNFIHKKKLNIFLCN